MDVNACLHIDGFVETTRDVLFLREEDSLLIIRPNKIQHVNRTAFEMLDSLYMKKVSAENTVKTMSAKYGLKEDTLLRDLSETLGTVNAIMREDYASAGRMRTVPYNPESIALPVLSEIALTYRCQNRCDFCYASSPYRGREMREMNTAEVKTVIDRIFDEARVPAISFTGGEPTLRDDLPELIAYAAKKGMRTNLITNGLRCADRDFTAALADAGLKSAQVSLESHDREIHNAVTGNPAAYDRVVPGIHNLASRKIHTHTNTTICSRNREHLIPLARFI
ncbi:MAG: radical SAM protein, partial [Spirochaetales bacterium]